jgi:hypothetical protein
MFNFKLVIGLFAIAVLSFIGCSESENINSPTNDSNSSFSTLLKSTDAIEGNAPPAEGIVIEGVSVPGIALGFTRAQVEDAYGAPQSCQSSGTFGNNAYCSFPVSGGGQVNVHYRGADGGTANGSPDDVVFKIGWTEATNGWTTTAGINTTLAKQNPQAVVAAYPDAQVTYNQFGNIYSVVDYPLGIEVIWVPDFYTGQIHVRMAIFYSMVAPPLPEKLTRVTDINLTTRKVRGKRQVQAYVKVQNEQNLAAREANVIASWTFPDGSTQFVEDATSNSGYAYFEIINVPRGTYALTVDDVVLEDHVFDRDNSVLSASVNVK